MTNPYYSPKPTREQRRSGCLWSLGLIIIVAVGIVIRVAFTDEPWVRPVLTVVAVLTAATLIGGYVNLAKMLRDLKVRERE